MDGFGGYACPYLSDSPEDPHSCYQPLYEFQVKGADVNLIEGSCVEVVESILRPLVKTANKETQTNVTNVTTKSTGMQTAHNFRLEINSNLIKLEDDVASILKILNKSFE